MGRICSNGKNCDRVKNSVSSCRAISQYLTYSAGGCRGWGGMVGRVNGRTATGVVLACVVAG
jgi:hypothetical protein